MDKAIRYGVILGFISVIWSLFVYAMGAEFTVSFLGTITGALFTIAAASFCAFRIKKESIGVITYGQAFLRLIVMVAIAAFINYAFSYLFFNFIDTEYTQDVTEAVIIATEERLDSMGMTEDQIEQAMVGARESLKENQKSPFWATLKAFFGSVIFGAIFAAIAAIFVRRKGDDEPYLEDQVADMKKPQ